MIVVWATIPGFVGIYEVSDQGEVVRVATHGRSPKPVRRTLSPHKRNKYLAVDLHRDDAREREYVHRLVWTAFKGEIPAGYEINHIDGDRANSRLDNLEIVTRSDNMLHCFQRLSPSLRRIQGVAHHKAKLTPEKVIEIRRLRNSGVDRKAVAESYGISRNAVRLIDIGKNWSHVV